MSLLSQCKIKQIIPGEVGCGGLGNVMSGCDGVIMLIVVGPMPPTGVVVV